MAQGSGDRASGNALERPLLLLSLGAAAFLVVIVAGYGFGWAWTGFRPNDTLWDWLNLVLLPVTLALTPLWMTSRRRSQTAWRLLAVVLAAGFAVVLIGGYGLGWRWTGFHGNTLWDWLKLFLVPFAVPVLIAGISARQNRQVPAVETHPRVVVEDEARPAVRNNESPPKGMERRP